MFTVIAQLIKIIKKYDNNKKQKKIGKVNR